ncbi:MAG: hypothetical protein GX116_06440 [Fibrobacter sp.]|nr:hypothetical protein [Fibrobacter sp.]
MMELKQKAEVSTKNRAFNCKMRNRYYEEVYYAFRALEPVLEDLSSSENRELWYSQMSLHIQKYESILSTCLEYAQAAIFYGKHDKLTYYNKDKRWGVLQEEIFMVNFLQELLSTIRYISSRIETDYILQELDISMQLKLETKKEDSGFISHLQKNLLALNKAMVKELLDLTNHLKDRFQIGNTVFGILQDLQHFY